VGQLRSSVKGAAGADGRVDAMMWGRGDGVTEGAGELGRDGPDLQRALRLSEERLRALADSMPQLVWTAGPGGAVDYYNARARLYAGLEALPDRTWTWQPLVFADDLPRTLEAWNTAVATGSDYECEHRVRMADGSLRWHVSRAHLVREDGRERWFGTATDIHEQKLAEESLRRAVATRDQVVSMVAHDLRNPLAVMRTSLPLLRKALSASPEGDVRRRGDASLSRLDRQVTKMEKLLDELLDVAQLQTGRPLALERRACDLVVLVRELAVEHSAASGNPKIELHTTAPTVVGDWDAARLERAIGNLLSNAIKYSPSGSEIVVEVERAGDHATVRVSDHGVGIPEADRERIFEWFARGENAERTARGIGVGLAGARRIVEEHGGSLTVESELRVGSTFTVRLPLKATSADDGDATERGEVPNP
jgi:PAS domain S-box-containing protein